MSQTEIERYAATLSAIESAEGDDPEDTQLLRSMGKDAKKYLAAMPWCRRIREGYFGDGVGGVVAVFLFRIEPTSNADEWVWVVNGDLPDAYFVTDRSPTASDALETYCELMSDWVDAVRSGGSLRDVFPVDAPATKEAAKSLAGIIEFLRSEILG
jgi:hypothetical protein